MKLHPPRIAIVLRSPDVPDAPGGGSGGPAPTPSPERPALPPPPPESEAPEIPSILPVLPVRNTVIFPDAMAPLSIGRPASRKMIEASLPQSKIIALFTQRNVEAEEPGAKDLYGVGVAAMILKLIRQEDDTLIAVVHGLERIAIRSVVHAEPFLRAEIEVLHSIPPPGEDAKWKATVKTLQDSASELIRLSPEAPEQAQLLVANIKDPGQLADFLAGSLSLELEQKQDLLETLDVVKRVRAVQARVSAQLEIARLQQKIQKDVASQFTDAQRRAYLREQIRAIQRELGEEGEGSTAQVDQLREQLTAAEPPPAVMEQAEHELKRLDIIPPASPEFSVIVSYVETMAELPWNRLSEDNLDLERARRVLDRDHFDLDKVKRRLIEFLAVRKLNPTGRGPILCFIGPPGVGKTSLGQSIADALGRKFSRLSLGGVRDEAEIRGHRRTYIGSMPGRIIQELRHAGTRNPVMMLDEIDKLGIDFRGDPASALLEVLDPRQNSTFVDHYLDVPFDLSQVIFIATANYMDPVPPALRDRMEVIELPGYTDREKLEIARRYLVGRQQAENGLKEKQCRFTRDALRCIINDYTHEAGVRELERQIGAVCRAVAARVAAGKRAGLQVTRPLVAELLGPAKYIRETRLKTSRPGVVTGLAWTPVGGEVLHVEAVKYPGKGNILLTGQIGDVMRESAQAALSLVRSRAKALGISEEDFQKFDLHIHVPAGAVPKDGPSAGVAMFTALASLFCDKPVRHDLAMTGEISLRGLVLPIGGLKEKCLAAMRAGLKVVVLPKLNEKDLPDIRAEAREKLRLVLVGTVDELLEAALKKPASTRRRGGTR